MPGISLRLFPLHPRNQPRQEDGTYFVGAPLQTQINVPLEGVPTSETVTVDGPMDATPVTPMMALLVAVVISDEETLPIGAIEQSVATVETKLLPAPWKDSVTQVRAPLAARINSETLARTV